MRGESKGEMGPAVEGGRIVLLAARTAMATMSSNTMDRRETVAKVKQTKGQIKASLFGNFKFHSA